jgi:flagellar assembly protein FliH
LLSEREKRAYERGRADGIQEGKRAAQQERAQHGKQLERALNELRARFTDLESQGADAVLDLALTIARQVVGREIELKRDAVLAPLREAIAAIIDQAAHPRIHLNPQDHELVRTDLEADGLFKGARIVADPAVSRGGCRVETPQCEVDATVETRWRRVLAALGCDEDRGSGIEDRAVSERDGAR